MNFSVLGDVNWLAVIVATIAYFAIGALWYSVLFSKPWTRAMGIDRNEGDQGNPAMYAVPLVTALVSTIAVAMLAEASGTDSVGEGLVLGLIAGLGVAAMAVAVTGFFDMRRDRGTLIAINAGYHVVGLLLAGIILGAWT